MHSTEHSLFLIPYLVILTELEGNYYQKSITFDCHEECSCGSDCEENGNCCFPTMQPYTSENEDYDHVLQNKRACLYPTTLDLQGRKELSYQPYYMITSVSSDRKSNSSCGDTRVALWGSLFPVYSAERNQIYKNSACATADGVTDGQSWEVRLTCGADFDNLYSDNRQMLLEPNDYVNRVVNSDFKYKNCHIDFIFQGSMEEIRHLQCYRDVIDDCPDFELLQTTDDIGFYGDEIIEACTSGLVSPYRRNKMYANVFCHICNYEQFKNDSICPAMSTSTLLGPFSRSFSGIIDAQVFLKEGRTNSGVTKPNTPVACRKQKEGSCRPVYCPSGQYDRSGKCKFSIQLLYDQTCFVYLNLTLDTYVNITEVLLRNTISAFKSPWPSNWRIRSIFFDITNEKKTRLMVIMFMNIHAVRVPLLIKFVQQMAKRDWTLEDNAATFVLKSDLNTFIHPVDSPVFFSFENRIEGLSFPEYINVFRTVNFITAVTYIPQTITRLYFCNQVELSHTEFILSDNKAVVFNIFTQRHLFDGEFILINGNKFGNFLVRICIEDSGLNKVNEAPVSSTNTFLTIFCVLVSVECVITL